MSKRKLSRQQRWRIEKIQAERAERAARKAGQDDEKLAAGEYGAERDGRVIAHFGRTLDVASRAGETPTRCHLRANLEGLVTGDRVIWRAGEDGSGVVVARGERDNVLERPDMRGLLKPVAANIDQILIVFAVEPEPHAGLIDRYLVAAEATGITPVLVLNKTDLLPDEGGELRGLLDRYRGIGYQVVATSTEVDGGLDALYAQLADRTSVFVGQSGVGKSSLIDRLLPDEQLRIGALSLELVGIMTHFQYEEADFVRAGLARFNEQSKWLIEDGKLDRSKLTLHTANSFTTLEVPEARLDMVRPGGIIYGDTLPSYTEYKKVMSFKTRVASVNNYPAGNLVGYDGTYTLQRDSLLANLPMGYSDGYRRVFTNKAYVVVNGHRAPVVGKVSMNTTMIDVTDIPGVKPGDEVVLFGKQGDAEVTQGELEDANGALLADLYTVWGNSNPKILKEFRRRRCFECRHGRGGLRMFRNVCSTSYGGAISFHG